MVNVLWALFNLLVAYLIVERVGKFEIRQTKCLCSRSPSALP